MNTIHPALVPYPLLLQTGEGNFSITAKPINIQYPSFLNQTALLLVKILENCSIPVTHNSTHTSEHVIKIVLAKNKINDEFYSLKITPKTIMLNAPSIKGLFYALQTLRQLLLQSSKNKITLPCLKISDKPRFAWRGMHLDVSRHFMPKDFIKKYIDHLAFLKMNTFHWHLVDDQGWRIEIPGYPELIRTGAWRDETLIGHDNVLPRKYDSSRHGGFYTTEDIREIVNYAQNQHITIVPEIEIPGHSQAAIASYPHLGCTGDKIKVRKRWGISPHVYNIEEPTFTFLNDVFDHVMDLFPSKYIHIGGDEAQPGQWKQSPEVQKRIRELNIQDENFIQSYFIKKIASHIEKHGRHIIGWDEIMDCNLSADIAIMAWQSHERGRKAVQNGHNVIMTPASHCYFDRYQSQDEEEPLAFGDYLPLEKVYNFEPIPEGLSDTERKLILGVQGNVWTEYMPDHTQVEYMLFPRIFAMAEIQWTEKEHKNYLDFLQRLHGLKNYLVQNRVKYAMHDFGQGTVK